MAVCPFCHTEMLGRISCNLESIPIAGEAYEPVPWGEERRFPQRVRITFVCRDCGTPPGGIHHHGCDVEECPACRGQQISCGCIQEEEEEEEEEWDRSQPQPQSQSPPQLRVVR